MHRSPPNKTIKPSLTKQSNKKITKTSKKSLQTSSKKTKISRKNSPKKATQISLKQSNFSSQTDSFPTFSSGPILTSLDNEILHVKFNNPKMLNAMNIEMGEKMQEIVSLLKIDNGKNVHAVILSGEGRGFSAGGDLKFLKARSEDTPANNTTEMLKFYSRFMSIREIPVPIISAINGPAVGAGAAVACLADMRVMSSNATIGWSFLPLGLHPGMGSTFFLPKLVNSPSIASHLLLSGDIIDAGLAKNFGIVHDVVQVDQIDDIELNNKLTLDAATVLARHYTKHQSLATFTLLKTLRNAQDVGLAQALEREATAQALTYASPEFAARLDKMINRVRK
jgi:enoyl-CoA hydratase/carnithine racemase